MKGYMYILECSDESYYTGSTKDLELRLQQHQSGLGANHTKKRLPVKLVYFEEFDRIVEAFYREKQVQGWSRKKKEALINAEHKNLHNLAECKNETHFAFDSAQATESRVVEPNQVVERNPVVERSRNHVPQIRFPEFKTAWEQKPLNNFLAESKKLNTDLKYDKSQVLSVSGELGIVNQIEHLGRSYAGASVHNYGIVEKGDIVYTKSPLKANPFGIIKLNKRKAGIVSTLYAVYKVKEKNATGEFLDYYFSLDANTNRYLRSLIHFKKLERFKPAPKQSTSVPSPKNSEETSSSTNKDSTALPGCRW